MSKLSLAQLAPEIEKCLCPAVTPLLPTRPTAQQARQAPCRRYSLAHGQQWRLPSMGKRHRASGEEGAVLEIFNAVGESIAVVIVPSSAIAPLRADQVPTVRPLLVAV